METILTNQATNPYEDSSTNLIYNLLFCDDIELYKKNTKQPAVYPWNILFSVNINVSGLQKIIGDAATETRHKILAYRMLATAGYEIENKDLLGVIVEVGLDGGLDVVASYSDGSARYINQTGKMIIWETLDATSISLTKDLFEKSAAIVARIGPWEAPRKPFPAKGMVRISFLVSDGLYFGEAPANVLFNDPLAKPALLSAAALMQFLTEKVLSSNSETYKVNRSTSS